MFRIFAHGENFCGAGSRAPLLPLPRIFSAWERVGVRARDGGVCQSSGTHCAPSPCPLPCGKDAPERVRIRWRVHLGLRASARARLLMFGIFAHGENFCGAGSRAPLLPLPRIFSAWERVGVRARDGGVCQSSGTHCAPSPCPLPCGKDARERVRIRWRVHLGLRASARAEMRLKIFTAAECADELAARVQSRSPGNEFPGSIDPSGLKPTANTAFGVPFRGLCRDSAGEFIPRLP
jgi:hypothetical protein